MDGLLLDGEHGQDVPVQVEPLVVGQDDLVALEVAGVAEPARVQVYDVERVILQRGARVGSHRLVVAVNLEEVRMRLLRQVRRRADDHIAAVVREQAALAVQVLPVGGHVGHMEQREEALEEPTADVQGALVVPVRQGLALLTLEQVFSSLEEAVTQILH